MVHHGTAGLDKLQALMKSLHRLQGGGVCFGLVGVLVLSFSGVIYVKVMHVSVCWPVDF